MGNASFQGQRRRKQSHNPALWHASRPAMQSFERRPPTVDLTGEWTPHIRRFLQQITANSNAAEAAASPWALTTILERIDHVWGTTVCGPLPGIVVQCREPREQWLATHVGPLRLALQRCPADQRFFVTPIVAVWSAWPQQQQHHSRSVERQRTVLLILDQTERSVALVEIVPTAQDEYNDSWYEHEFIPYFRLPNWWFDGLPDDAVEDNSHWIRGIMPQFATDPTTPLAVLACLCRRFGLYGNRDLAGVTAILRDAVAADPELAPGLSHWARCVASAPTVSELLKLTDPKQTKCLRRILGGRPCSRHYGACTTHPRAQLPSANGFATLAAAQKRRNEDGARPGWGSVPEDLLRTLVGQEDAMQRTAIVYIHAAMLQPVVPLVRAWGREPAQWLFVLLVGFDDPWSALADTLAGSSLEVPRSVHAVVAIAQQSGHLRKLSLVGVMQHAYWQNRLTHLLLFQDTDLLALQTSARNDLWPRLVDHTNVGALEYLDVRAEENEDWDSLLLTGAVHPCMLRISTPYSLVTDTASDRLLWLLLYHQTPWRSAERIGLLTLDVTPLMDQLMGTAVIRSLSVEHPRGWTLRYRCASAAALERAATIVRKWKNDTLTVTG